MARVLLSLMLSFLFLVGDAFAGVDVNVATQRELQSLPGIGPSKATAIIEFRDSNGAFSSLADLDKVPGIGPATLDNLRPLVEFGGETAPASPTSASAPAGSKSTASGGARVNINQASGKELETLPGMGPRRRRPSWETATPTARSRRAPRSPASTASARPRWPPSPRSAP